MISSIKTCFFQ